MPLDTNQPSPTSIGDDDDDPEDPTDEPRETSTTSSDTDSSLEVDSDGESLLAQYGVQVPGKTKKSQKNEDDENEAALLQLAGHRGQGRTKRDETKAPRARRDSDSEDEDENFEKCYLCNTLVPKTEYLEHVTREMEEKKRLHASKNTRQTTLSTLFGSNSRNARATVGPTRSAKRNKEEAEDENEQALAELAGRKRPRLEKKTPKSLPSVAQSSKADNKFSQNTNVEDQSEEEEDAQFDEMSNSPIKSFRLIGEHANSVVDYQNQFAHLKTGKAGRKRGARGGSTSVGWYQESGSHKRKGKWKKWKQWKKR